MPASLRAAFAALLLLVSGQAFAATVLGPVYPPPGGVTFSGTGNALTGSRVNSYSGFNLAATDELYWGFYSVGLAMDGTINAPGESLSLNLALSNLAAGQAVYTGTTQVSSFGVPQTVFTRLVMTVTDLSNGALALTTAAAVDPTLGAGFALLNVNGGFKATYSLLASNNATSGFTAAGTYFDAVPGKSPAANQLQSSVSGGFYYTENAAAVPEPATWAMLIVGFGAVGGSLRSRRIGMRVAV